MTICLSTRTSKLTQVLLNSCVLFHKTHPMVKGHQNICVFRYKLDYNYMYTHHSMFICTIIFDIAVNHIMPTKVGNTKLICNKALITYIVCTFVAPGVVKPSNWYAVSPRRRKNWEPTQKHMFLCSRHNYVMEGK